MGSRGAFWLGVFEDSMGRKSLVGMFKDEGRRKTVCVGFYSLYMFYWLSWLGTLCGDL